jgi:hypothetical protein
MGQRNRGPKAFGPWAILLSHFMATPFTAFSTLVQPLQAFAVVFRLRSVG